ncbi:hypothetical protein HYP71_gp057 [Arthrobacter phage KBurrousTX]|uniref:Uncharacterized protein n=1 Tax=Arthrobacter phage KBurrousTX TaxID=2315608 RepID=A0A386K8B9_9CAUD|nr:hypothetical protein HYP71_gp057 [Arthrobacter phage KBurrousTX]AYD81551.1 hypothetical protein KBurrousTX_57 [Arthrobacter phage KBurrousTX]
MRITKRQGITDAIELDDDPTIGTPITIHMRNGAAVSITETDAHELLIVETSHRTLRVAPGTANSLTITTVDSFLEAEAPMIPIPSVAELCKVPTGSKLYSVATKTVWTWHGGGLDQITKEGFIVTNTADDSGFATTPEFWQRCAPLLLAATP